MAMIMPIATNTTIATCIQIQVGDIGLPRAYFAGRHTALQRVLPARPARYATMLFAWMHASPAAPGILAGCPQP